MIIGSFVPFTVGERRTGLIDGRSQVHAGQPFVVLRPATAEEWIIEALAQGGDEATVRRLARLPEALFYDVAVD